MNHFRQSLLAAALALGLCAAGCSRQQSADATDQRHILAHLPATLASKDAELRAELDRLQRQNQLPWQQLARQVPEEENAAAVLVEQLAGLDAEPLAAEAAPLLAQPGLQFSLTDQEAARELLERFDTQRRAARQALQLPDASFGVEPAEGLLAQLACIGQARLIVRLEGFAAAAALGRLGPVGGEASVNQAAAAAPAADLDEATEAVVAMLQWVDTLAREPHTVCRLEAIHLRGEALLALEAVAQHPEITGEHLQRLEDCVKRSLAQWPNDADVCQAERILGMQMYELVRSGRYDAVSSEDPQAMPQAELMRRVRRMKPQQIDRDELFYLRAMDRISRHCQEDFPARQPLFAQLRSSAGTPDADDYPAIAMHVLLHDIERLHRFLTFDRARMEGWAVALASARGEAPPALGKSPRTGEAYRIAERPDRVSVQGHGSLEADEAERPIVVRKVLR